MINSVKRFGIGLVDLISDLILDHTFSEFTRPIIPPPKDDPLWVREQQFYSELISLFWTDKGTFLYNRPMEGEPMDFGDLALHHGIDVAMLSWKLLAQGSEDTARVLEKSAAALLTFWQPSDDGDGYILVRGRHPLTGEVRYDVSNDGATGHAFGIYNALQSGNAEARTAARTCLQYFVQMLVKNDYSCVDPNGKHTTYGELINGTLTDPARATLCLTILKMGEQKLAAGDSIQAMAAQHFAKLWKRYGRLVDLSEFKFLWLTKSHEAHRCAMNLYVLAELMQQSEDEPGYVRCLNGLARIVNLESRTANWWILALASRHMPARAMKEGWLNVAIGRLREIGFDERGPRVERRNSLDPKRWAGAGIHFREVGGKLRATQPLPLWTLGQQDFMPQRDLQSVDDNVGDTSPHRRYPGRDFLAPYWCLRRHALIGDDT